MNTMVGNKTVRRKRIVAGFAALAMVLLGGCAGAGKDRLTDPNEPIGLPTPLPPASSNSFTGTQGTGLWSVSLDDTQERFSYQAITYPASPNVPTSGSFLPVSGFQTLTNLNAAPGGYAVEVPGRVALLQPGNNTVAPVIAVEQDSCFPINGAVRFEFVHMPSALLSTSQTGGYPVYGSLAAQTNADGSSWTFGDQVQYLLPYTLGASGIGQPVQPGTPGISQTSYLQTFGATCSVTNGQAKLSAPPNVSSSKPVSTMPTSLVIGTTGFFIEDQSTGTQSAITPDATSLAGVVQPSLPLTTASVVTAKYVGFLEEAGHLLAGATVKTEPIGFGQIVAGSGTSMTGGTYLNDDITQLQNSNIVINLGTQDTANNGLYPLASITVPDPANVCFIDLSTGHFGAGGTPGVDQYGNETCTFNAVAVAGNPENKFAIFIASYDVTTNLSMGIYLFQQN